MWLFDAGAGQAENVLKIVNMLLRKPGIFGPGDEIRIHCPPSCVSEVVLG